MVIEPSTTISNRASKDPVKESSPRVLTGWGGFALYVARSVALGLSEIHKTVASPERLCEVFMSLCASFSENSERGASITEQVVADADVESVVTSVSALRHCGDSE